jgi:hypothetical protein
MMKNYSTYRNIKPTTATGICPIGAWNGTGVLYLNDGGTGM